LLLDDENVNSPESIEEANVGPKALFVKGFSDRDSAVCSLWQTGEVGCHSPSEATSRDGHAVDVQAV
jgi:hypothetical protein